MWRLGLISVAHVCGIAGRAVVYVEWAAIRLARQGAQHASRTPFVNVAPTLFSRDQHQEVFLLPLRKDHYWRCLWSGIVI